MRANGVPMPETEERSIRQLVLLAGVMSTRWLHQVPRFIDFCCAQQKSIHVTKPVMWINSLALHPPEQIRLPYST